MTVAKLIEELNKKIAGKEVNIRSIISINELKEAVRYCKENDIECYTFDLTNIRDIYEEDEIVYLETEE